MTSSGAQSYGAATLGADATLNGSAITLSSVTGATHSLALIGASVLNGAITGLNTLNTGAVTFNNGNVTSTGVQSYGAATLNAPTVLTSNNGNINFNTTLSGGSQSLTLAGGTGGNHVFTINDVASLGTLTVNGNSSVTNTLALLTGTGTNTWTVTNNGTGTIAATNMTSGGFSNIQNLTGGAATNDFVFNNNATLTGNVVGGGSGTNNTLTFSAYSAPVTVNLSQNTAPGIIGGSFSNINNFAGSGTNSNLVGASNTTWTINNTNAGTADAAHFSGFGNLTGSTGTNNFVLTNAGNIGGSITGGSGSNTLTVATANADWTVSGANTGSIAGVVGGFSNIQNLTGGTGTNTFNFTGNSSVSGLINGGNTTQTNVVNYNGYNGAITLALAVPTSGNELNTGTVNNNASSQIGSFTQVQEVVGTANGQSVLILPNKPNVSVTYTNPSHTSGFVDDPFFFINMRAQTAPIPPPNPTPNPSVTTDVSQIITPFTKNPPDTRVTSTDSIDQMINGILQQEIDLDNNALFIDCYHYDKKSECKKLVLSNNE